MSAERRRWRVQLPSPLSRRTDPAVVGNLYEVAMRRPGSPASVQAILSLRVIRTENESSVMRGYADDVLTAMLPWQGWHALKRGTPWWRATKAQRRHILAKPIPAWMEHR